LMCAIEAGKRGRRVVVLEHNAQVGRKILISGGGRCNFTNLHIRPENFLSANPHFAKSALARYTPHDFLALVERHGIRYFEKTAGQLFCDGSAREIVEMLEAECATAGVRIETGRAVRSVTRSDSFQVVDDQESWRAESLVIATGGLSVPKIGATPFGYSLAEQFGLRIVERRPALVPLTFGRDDLAKFGMLAGVSCEAVVRAGGHSFREKMLFTHRGLSGPAVLQASSYWKPGEAVEIDLLPNVDVVATMTRRRSAGDRSQFRTLLAEWLPKRLADRWCEVQRGEVPGSEVQGATKPIAVTGNREIAQFSSDLHCWRVTPVGTEGYEKAEVTAGGIDTAELSSQTMEAKSVPGLYFVGEVVDVTGQLGGFNFQWAWASGFAAGQHA
jgi:predicted Rossmann fold flavoprotein